MQEEISVPREKHGFLIGARGAIREEIQMESHATILIPAPKESSDLVKIIGRKENVAAAKAKIQAVLAAAVKDAPAPTRTKPKNSSFSRVAKKKEKKKSSEAESRKPQTKPNRKRKK